MNQKTKAAFTLIELLVVVLIIGILAAVAVPQYQKAIRKTHYNNMLQIIRPVIEAERAFYLANGRYATTLNELDIQIPITPGTCMDISILGTNGVHVGTDYCLYLTGGYKLQSIFISFDGAKLGLEAGYARSSGYQYLLKPNANITWDNKIKIHTLYCKELGISGKSPRKDFHCTGQILNGNNWGAWFEMN